VADNQTTSAPGAAPQPTQPLTAILGANPTLLALVLLLGGGGLGHGVFKLTDHTADEVRGTRTALMERTAELIGEVRGLAAKVDDQTRRTTSLEGELKEIKAQINSFQASRWTREDQDRFADALERWKQKIEEQLRGPR
jgi:uncharacterized protein YukE